MPAIPSGLIPQSVTAQLIAAAPSTPASNPSNNAAALDRIREVMDVNSVSNRSLYLSQTVALDQCLQNLMNGVAANQSQPSSVSAPQSESNPFQFQFPTYQIPAEQPKAPIQNQQPFQFQFPVYQIPSEQPKPLIQNQESFQFQFPTYQIPTEQPKPLIQNQVSSASPNENPMARLLRSLDQYQ